MFVLQQLRPFGRLATHEEVPIVVKYTPMTGPCLSCVYQVFLDVNVCIFCTDLYQLIHR